VHNAISRLLEKDVYKLYLLIEALKAISNNQSSKSTTTILNEVEKYLNSCLTEINTDASKASSEEPAEWVQKIYQWFQHGVEIHTEINSLSQDRKQELIALGYFLQGELSTKEEFNYIKKVLRSYLKTITQFRSSRPPNS